MNKGVTVSMRAIENGVILSWLPPDAMEPREYFVLDPADAKARMATLAGEWVDLRRQNGIFGEESN